MSFVVLACILPFLSLLRLLPHTIDERTDVFFLDDLVPSPEPLEEEL